MAKRGRSGVIDLSLMLTLFSIWLLAGCASLGSSAEIRDQVTFSSLKTVYVAPVSTNLLQVAQLRGDRVGISPTLQIIQQLKGFGQFTVVNDDSIFISENEAREFGVSESNVVELAGKYSPDAYVYTNMNYSFVGIPGMTGIDAAAEIKFVDYSTRTVIAECKHSTASGNSYFLPPPVDKITTDAVKGALKALRKKTAGFK